MKMEDSAWREEVARRVPLAQIIVMAVACGCVAFLAIALVIVGQREAAEADESVPLLTYVALFVAAGAVCARLVVPAAVMSRSREQIVRGTWQLPASSRSRAGIDRFLERTGDGGRLWLLLLTRIVLSTALLEGAGFFCILVYLLEGSVLSLAAAIALVVGLLLHFPTRRSVLHWIENQLRIVDDQRALGR